MEGLIWSGIRRKRRRQFVQDRYRLAHVGGVGADVVLHGCLDALVPKDRLQDVRMHSA